MSWLTVLYNNNRNIRHCKHLNVLKYRSTTEQWSLAYRGDTVWNKLDNSIKYEVDWFKHFKSKLKANLRKIFP